MTLTVLGCLVAPTPVMASERVGGRWLAKVQRWLGAIETRDYRVARETLWPIYPVGMARPPRILSPADARAHESLVSGALRAIRSLERGRMVEGREAKDESGYPAAVHLKGDRLRGYALVMQYPVSEPSAATTALRVELHVPGLVQRFFGKKAWSQSFSITDEAIWAGRMPAPLERFDGYAPPIEVSPRFQIP